MIQERDHRENLLRNTKLFETMSDEQITKLAGALERLEYDENVNIITQGEPGEHFYLLEDGEAAALIKMGEGEQEVKRYVAGDLFGEKALLESAPRGATIRACTPVTCFALSRTDFEEKLGPLSQLKAEQYLADPRKLLHQFYCPGDTRGPAGTLKAKDLEQNPGEDTKWFVVFRPCSRDSIAKMLGKIGVGKGLNVKGKSAKKNRLSGFVPFVQISENKHKKQVEVGPPHGRMTIYYKQEDARNSAKASMEKVLAEKEHLISDDRACKVLDEYAPDCYGLDVPECAIREAYLMMPDLSPMVGWETGRASEPAFMNMNMGAVRGHSKPNVVLYQFDQNDPMNPLGLLIAYAEGQVKPVVSDFDCFTVGSKGFAYNEPTPPKQVELIKWSLGHTQDILFEESDKGWTSRWLEVLKSEAEKGFAPVLPKYGFGDPTSYNLIADVVDMTVACGAVRHGAECFNFYFPQELDEDFLIVWDGFTDEPPWRNVSEPELREFLLERAKEGFTFPINPVWPVRDIGWYEVLQALRENEDPIAQRAMESWFPPQEEGEQILEMIDEIHDDNPDGLRVAQRPGFLRDSRKSMMTNAMDMTGCEIADFAGEQVRKVVQKRWRRIRFALLMAAKMAGQKAIAQKRAAAIKAGAAAHVAAEEAETAAKEAGEAENTQ
jgi:hypothetical protein